MAQTDQSSCAGERLGVAEAALDFLGQAGAGLLALLYPPRCAICDLLDTSYLCPGCRSQIEAIDGPICGRCGVPLDEPGICGYCRDHPRSFRTARSAGRFSGVLRELIHRFKYTPAKPLADPLADILLGCLLRWRAIGPEHFDMIVPVPIHPLRLRARDYNQSAELARGLGSRIGMPVYCRALRKIRETRPQTTLSARERKTNLRGAFAVVRREGFEGARVLLIDDVMTTGATADECSRTLVEAGAKEVRVLTLARESDRV
jgi:ComF family protein